MVSCRELASENGKLSIRDLNSHNGTFVDGKPVRSATIKVGSSLRIGRVTFDVVDRVADRSPSECDEEETDRGPVTEPGDAALRAAWFSHARRQVLELLLDGYSEKQVAYRLDLSDYQVHRHVKGIYRCFGVHSRAALCASVHGKVDTPVEMMAPLQEKQLTEPTFAVAGPIP